MQNDVFSEFHVDFEGLGRPRGRRDSATEGNRALRLDRTHSARWFADGVAVVALSSPQGWGKFRKLAVRAVRGF